MATIYYEAEDCYSVTDASFPLKISVKIGDGQGGAYLIFNGAELIGANAPGMLKLMAATDEWITISATIKDKLDETNWTSISIFFDDPSKHDPVKFGPYKREVPTHLDTVVYTIRLKIIKPTS